MNAYAELQEATDAADAAFCDAVTIGQERSFGPAKIAFARLIGRLACATPNFARAPAQPTSISISLAATRVATSVWRSTANPLADIEMTNE